MQRLIAAVVFAALLVVPGTAAAAAPGTEPFSDVLVNVDNPCTNSVGDVHLDGWLRLQGRVTPSGGFHLLVHLDVTWWATDGFAGTAKQTTTIAARGEGEVIHTTVHFVGRDGEGRVVLNREQLNVRIAGDGPAVVIEHLESTCHGRGS